MRQLITALAACGPAASLEANVITPTAVDVLTLPAISARPHLPGDAGKLEFEQVTFPRAAAALQADLVHVPHWGPPFRSSLPVVVTVHDLIPLVLPAYRGSLLVRAYTQLAAASTRRARLVIADSQATQRDIVNRLHIPPERVRIVHLAADPRLGPVSDPAGLARVRARYQLPERFVLYIGGFDARKNVRTLIRAFDALTIERDEGWKLVLAGPRPRRNSSFFPDPLQDASAAVQSIGYIDEEDKPVIYSLASFVAFPSLYEGFGLTPLEAMTCGAPVICSNTSSLPEVTGDAALLLDPERVDDWTAALRAWIADPEQRSEARERGLRQARRFSWDRVARETLAIYRDALPFDQ